MSLPNTITQRVESLQHRFRLPRPGDSRQRAADRETDETELELYRFWHLDYGATAYYDQLVFKRHGPIPPRRACAGAVDEEVTLGVADDVQRFAAEPRAVDNGGAEMSDEDNVPDEVEAQLDDLAETLRDPDRADRTIEDQGEESSIDSENEPGDQTSVDN